MGWRAYFAFIFGGGVFLSLAVGMFFWTHSDPPTSAIEQDLAQIDRELKVASGEASKYSGGFVLALVESRSQVLRLTKSMLEAKKRAWLRRINLNFSVEGRAVRRQPPEELAKIEQELRETDRRIADAEGRAQQYTGGLIQGMELIQAATERVSRSQLMLAYYSAKYGLILPPVPKVDEATAKREPPANNIVSDKEGL